MEGVIGVEKNTVMEEVIRDKYNNQSHGDENNKDDDEEGKIKLYDNHSDLLSGLERDEVDAVILEVLQAEVVTQNNNEMTDIMMPNEKNTHYYYGFVFNKDSKLLEKFNKVLDEIDSEGKIDILKLRWFSGYGMYNNN